MAEPDLNKIFSAKMTDSDFRKLSNYIYTEYGIKMPPAKRIMLQSRLQKRLRQLNITSYKEYIDFVFSKEGLQLEIFHMIDAISTNKTDFFREPSHFEFLKDHILPDYYATSRKGVPLRAWSAGCSSGEEPYTMAIVFSEFGLLNSGFDYSIFATDISTRMLKKGVNAIYAEERIAGIPLSLKKRYFLRSKDRTKKTVRVTPALRRKVSFKRLNFMAASYDVYETFDMIFCRNVLIYFDRETQEKVINKLCLKLKSGGYFFLGHSESIMNMNLPLKQVRPTVFRRI